MTSDLDLSPEAVERLAAMLDRASGSTVLRSVYLDTRDAEWCAVTAAATLRALAAGIERLTVEIDRLAAALDEMTRRRNAWRDKAAGHDELRAAVRAGIEQAGERNLSRVFLRGALVESEQSLAEARAELTRLRAERDAALQAGAESMREEVAEWVVVYGSRDPLDIAHDIRALPLPGQPKEGAPPFQAPTLDTLLSVATDDEADAIRSAACRANIEVPE